MSALPIHLLSLGAGVQSSCLSLMAECGEVLPKPAGAVFADTQDEPESVYGWLKWLETQLSFKVERVTRGRLSEAALTMRMTKDGRRFSNSDIPFFTLNHDGTVGKIVQRSCTRDFKIKPIISFARRAVGKESMQRWRRTYRIALKEFAMSKREKRPCNHSAWMEMQSDPLVVQWIGISLDEISRMKPTRDPWITNRWPLVEKGMKRHDCLRWMESHGFPRPPRSACNYCPFHDQEEWRRLKEFEPLEFQKAVVFEQQLQAIKALSQNFDTKPFLHRSCVPLSEVDFSTEEERGQGDMFQNECEGMCGV